MAAQQASLVVVFVAVLVVVPPHHLRRRFGAGHPGGFGRAQPCVRLERLRIPGLRAMYFLLANAIERSHYRVRNVSIVAVSK
ncbi:MAG TPA: hypothetical protein VJ482_10795 [Acidimicrobiia bacterium]|nr:hypothetical protein [Acidimicrobiia bacterium]